MNTRISHIPLPKSHRSRSLVRTNSGLPADFRTSATKKRSNSLIHLRKTLQVDGGRSTSNYSRPNSITPGSSSGSRRRSPYRSPHRHPNDKQWANEEFAKVRDFLLNHTVIDTELLASIKPPPTITHFCFIMQSLFEYLKINTELNTTNYKEIVMSKFKVLRYPGQLSMNLLKSVNTSHSWPQVVALFSWLMSVCIEICNLKAEVDVKKPFLSYMCERYRAYNNMTSESEVDDKYREITKKLYNYDEISAADARRELVHLRRQNEQYKNDIRNRHNELEKYKEIETKLSEECEKFRNDKDRSGQQLKDDIDNAEQRLNDLDTKKARLLTQKQELETVIKTQPYNLDDKNELLKQIDQAKYTAQLQTESLEKILDVKNEYDFRYSDTMQKMQSRVYHLNSAIVKQSLIKPELKDLMLPTSGFNNPDFTKKIIDVNEELKKQCVEIDKEIEECQNFIAHLDVEETAAEKQLVELDKQLETVKEKIKQLEIKNERRSKEIEVVLVNIQHLHDDKVDLDKPKEQLNQLIKVHEEVTEANNKTMINCLEFFKFLRSQEHEKIVKAKEVLDNIQNGIKKMYENLKKQQDGVMAELNKLNDL